MFYIKFYIIGKITPHEPVLRTWSARVCTSQVTLSLTSGLKSLALLTLNVHFISAAKSVANSLQGTESRLKLDVNQENTDF